MKTINKTHEFHHFNFHFHGSEKCDFKISNPLFGLCCFVFSSGHHSIKTSSIFFSKNDQNVDTPEYLLQWIHTSAGNFFRKKYYLSKKKLKLLFFCLLSGRRRVGNSVIISGLPAGEQEVYPSPPHLLPWLLADLCIASVCKCVQTCASTFANL